MKLKLLILTTLTICATLVGAASITVTLPATTSAPEPVVVPPPGPGPTPIAIPDSLPIESVGHLFAYAWEQIEHGNSQVYGPMTSDSPTNQTYHYMPDLEPDLAPTWLASLKYDFGFYFVQQSAISMETTFWSRDGNVLFFGVAQTSLAWKGEAWGFANPSYQIRMNDFVPITVPASRYAYIEERDDKGNVVSYYHLGQNNGATVLFPVYYAGKKGVLVMELVDGTRVVYSLQDGYRAGVENFSDSNRVSIEGLTVLKNTNVVYVEVANTNTSQQVVAPTARLTLTNMTEVFFSSWILPRDVRYYGDGYDYTYTAPLEYAYYAIVRKSAMDPNPVGVYIDPNRVDVPALPAHVGKRWLKPGSYWIEFVYPSGFGRWGNDGNGHQRPNPYPKG